MVELLTSDGGNSRKKLNYLTLIHCSLVSLTALRASKLLYYQICLSGQGEKRICVPETLF